MRMGFLCAEMNFKFSATSPGKYISKEEEEEKGESEKISKFFLSPWI